MNQEIMEVLLANRLYLYELGNRIFGGVPSMEFLELLSGEQTLLSLELLSEEENDTYAEGCRFLEKMRENLSKEGFLDYVKTEYMHVMEGPGKLKAYPWASTHVGKEPLIFQECTLMVRNTYQKFGIKAKDYGHVAEDHIAIELHFMARMAKLAQEAFEKNEWDKLKYYLQGQADFLRSHMTYWVPMYAEAIKENEDAKIYPRLVALYNSFLKDDLASVNEMVLSLMN